MNARKYLALASTAARHSVSSRAAIFGRMGFYALLLFIFSRLWEVVLAQQPIAGIGADNYVWYVAITEWIILSLPMAHTEVEDDLRTGALVYRLTRPTPYPAAKLAEVFGDALVRMGFLGTAGFVFAWAITGTVPMSPGTFALLIPVGVLAAALSLVFYFIIGLTSFWIHDCHPVYWLWQKAGFVLGGLLVPLELYPDWLRRIAEVSPFAAILHGPGSLALGADPASVLPVVAKLGAWTGVAIVLVIIVYRAALRRVVVGGG
jgi:ABC-2 type transport system permease protein